MSTVWPDGAYMLWDGVNWNILNAPPPDSLISTDPDNIATLGLDGLVYVAHSAYDARNDARFVNTTGDTMTGSLSLAADPSSALQAATKQYVDNKAAAVAGQIVDEVWVGDSQPSDPALELWHDTSIGVLKVKVGGSWTLAAPDPALKVSKAGDTMTGPLGLPADPSSALQAATKQYVDARVAKTGDTMTGPLELSGNASTALQAVPKQQLDAAISASGVPAGTIAMWAGAAAPSGWQICDGSALLREEHPRLFTAIGTDYGDGDGVTTFAVPNLKGRVPTGLDTSQTEFNTLSKTGGAKTHTLTTAQIPSHSHGPSAGTQFINYIAGGGTMREAASGNLNQIGATTTDPAGGGSSHPILQPYFVVNFIIKL